MSTAEFDAEMADWVAQYRAERAYIGRLKEAGLWRPGRVTIEVYQQKAALQQATYAEFPDVALPMFALEKAETAAHMQELVEQWDEEHSGYQTLTAEEFWRAVWARPNHDRDYPDLLLTLIEDACLTEAAIRELVPDIWMRTEFPGNNGGMARWEDAFNQAGWISDDDDHPDRPTEPLTLYRGAVPDHMTGMSWTGTPERAAWFAARFTHGPEVGRVYRRTFQPTDVLARFIGRGEDEWVCWVEDWDEIEEMPT